MSRQTIRRSNLCSLAAVALALAVSPGGARAEDRSQPRPVTISMHVPADAEVWFDDTRTVQTGAFRAFVSPRLTPGQDYVYTLRVRWVEANRTVERTRRLTIRAGDGIALEFSDRGVAEARGYADALQAPVSTPVYQFAPVLDWRASPTRAMPFSEQSPSKGAGPPGSNSPMSQGVGNG
jgi:uncharacterized protein (TIGR03000 family)